MLVPKALPGGWPMLWGWAVNWFWPPRRASMPNVGFWGGAFKGAFCCWGGGMFGKVFLLKVL